MKPLNRKIARTPRWRGGWLLLPLAWLLMMTAASWGAEAPADAPPQGGTVLRAIEAGGYLVLFALLFACGLGLPLPEDIPLTIAGYLVAIGQMHLAVASTCAWCGIIGGDCVLYHLSRKYGLEVTRLPLIGKHVTRSRIEKVERLFERWGTWVVAFGRLLAGIRFAMVIAAGVTRFSFIKFLVADGLAAVVSGGVFVALGYWLGVTIGDLTTPEAQNRIKELKHFVLAVAVVLVVGMAFYIWFRRKKHETLAEAAIDKVVEPKVHDSGR